MQQTEYRSATLALTPMMLAERDREYLKQCRRCGFESFWFHQRWWLVINFRNRDAEAKLMANEEGWEVGTWYGHPIYKVGGISYSLNHILIIVLPSIPPGPEGHFLCIVCQLLITFLHWKYFFRPLGTSGLMLLLMNFMPIVTSKYLLRSKIFSQLFLIREQKGKAANLINWLKWD